MNLETNIEKKLQEFSRKFYTNELIKGSILFISLGLIYFFFTVFIEYFLWLKPTARTILFWLFIVIELFLLIRFIGFPIFKLIGLQKGISSKEASVIIGNHFPEVGDKLLNILQLQEQAPTDLLLASIKQKSTSLAPIPFKKAVSFSTNKKYLKFAIVPLLILGFIFFSGSFNKVSNSFTRVVNHSVAYAPPAPFLFSLTANSLEVIQGNPLTVYVEVKGEVIPEEVKIVFDNQQYYMQNEGSRLFSYTFSEVTQPIDFYVKSSEVISNNFTISVIKTPTIQQVSMQLLYPRYTGKRNETKPNTGNVIVPEGTSIIWNVTTSETTNVTFISDEKKAPFTQKENAVFTYKKRILNPTNYEIATSNNKLKEYEKLQFSVDVVKDEKPTISVNSNIDSVSRGPVQFAGQIADDYGFKKLELVYYDENSPETINTYPLDISRETIQTFYYQFPDGLNLQKGINYELYFQVFDNDYVNGSKKAISKKFSFRNKTSEEIDEEILQEQRNAINNYQNTLKKQKKSKQELESIQFNLQNKKNMNWNDQKTIKNFVKRQQQYNQMMQRQTKKIENNFEEKEELTPNLEQKKQEIKERIKEFKKLQKQQKMFNELMEMAQKLKREDLIKKTKEIAQQNKQQQRSLERILEMTKRFYVQQKSAQLSKKFENLAKKQEELSKKDATKEEQDKLNKEFEKAKKEHKELQKDNENLKEPMEIPDMEEMKREVDKQQKEASKNLEQQNSKQAKQNQKKAAKKMKEMSAQMNSSMESSSAQMNEENMEGLRKILENILNFSFQQENLISSFSGTSSAHPNFGKNLKKQNDLRTFFEHIDDSLYVLSMRVPQISSKVQDELSTIYFNLDQSLENFAENRFSRGINNQRYVLTSVNVIADILSDVLNAMQNPSMSKSGKGKGKKDSFSLPDIIQQQNEIMKKMQQGMQKKGKQGKPKNQQNGQQQNGESEQMNGELFKIYQQQSQLREQLQEMIKNGNDPNGEAKKALKKMEQLENQILEKGFNQNTIQQMQKLQYQLLKLDKAKLQQGDDKKRKSTTNYNEFNNNKKKVLEFKKRYLQQTEILNRQSLPLRQNYKKKVKEYFKNN